MPRPVSRSTFPQSIKWPTRSCCSARAALRDSLSATRYTAVSSASRSPFAEYCCHADSRASSPSLNSRRYKGERKMGITSHTARSNTQIHNLPAQLLLMVTGGLPHACHSPVPRVPQPTLHTQQHTHTQDNTAYRHITRITYIPHSPLASAGGPVLPGVGGCTLSPQLCKQLDSAA